MKGFVFARCLKCLHHENQDIKTHKGYVTQSVDDRVHYPPQFTKLSWPQVSMHLWEWQTEDRNTENGSVRFGFVCWHGLLSGYGISWLGSVPILLHPVWPCPTASKLTLASQQSADIGLVSCWNRNGWSRCEAVFSALFVLALIIKVDIFALHSESTSAWRTC